MVMMFVFTVLCAKVSLSSKWLNMHLLIENSEQIPYFALFAWGTLLRLLNCLSPWGFFLPLSFWVSPSSDGDWGADCVLSWWVLSCWPKLTHHKMLHQREVLLEVTVVSVSQFHSLTEIGNELWRSLCPSPFLKQGLLQSIAKDHLQRVFHYLQGSRPHKLCG